MNKKHGLDARVMRRLLIFWTLFIGLGAVAGALAMLLDPTGKALGMDAMLPYFQVLPFAQVVFQNFTFSGWALLIVNGLSNLTAAGLLLAKQEAGIVLGGVFGVTLMLWICIQFYMFPLNLMSTAYFVFGAAQAVTGYDFGFFLMDNQVVTLPTVTVDLKMSVGNAFFKAFSGTPFYIVR